nr:MAG TPA: hypothetical protein [Bacteriophage sp.]
MKAPYKFRIKKTGTSISAQVIVREHIKTQKVEVSQ